MDIIGEHLCEVLEQLQGIRTDLVILIVHRIQQRHNVDDLRPHRILVFLLTHLIDVEEDFLNTEMSGKESAELLCVPLPQRHDGVVHSGINDGCHRYVTAYTTKFEQGWSHSEVLGEDERIVLYPGEEFRCLRYSLKMRDVLVERIRQNDYGVGRRCFHLFRYSLCFQLDAQFRFLLTLKIAGNNGRCRDIVLSVSTKESVEIIRQGKKSGVDVTCETGPHYLVLCEDDLREDGRFKMNPPLRGADDRDALLEGLLDGTVDMIATDHAPHSAEEKARGLLNSAFGIVGLECAFPVLYTELVLKKSLLTLPQLIEKLTAAPKTRFGLPGGTLADGQPADLTLIDLNAEYRVDPSTFLSMGRATPFEGREVAGRIDMTLCNGQIAWERTK